MFEITDSPSTNDVELLGVLWGSNGTSFWFGPIGNVYNELALIESEVFDSCDPSFNC